MLHERNVKNMAFDIFISYRRVGGDTSAKLIQQILIHEGYHPFLDAEDMHFGMVHEQISAALDECEHFILICTPHALDLCQSEGDLVRQEILEALKQKKNIIPFMTTGFEYPEKLPMDIADIRDCHGVLFDLEHFDLFRQDLLKLLASPTRDHEQKNQASEPSIIFEGADEEDIRRAHFIEEILGSLNAKCTIQKILHGPAVTRFILRLAPGVLLSTFLGAIETLEFQLAVKGIRTEAPIPGTSHIGLEVPNRKPDAVPFGEILEYAKSKNVSSPLSFPLGKDVAGTPILCDLSRMFPLLIAGATGSGKTVCIHSIVCSLLQCTSPRQVRFIMIDPVQVDLYDYYHIPHLLCPVISDLAKAARVLSWAVQEMMDRYDLFRRECVRNLDHYNKKVQGSGKELPNIVIIVNELIGLMDLYREDVEESIRRLAALSRSAGIFMILSTQRPSEKVITNVIRKNILNRIAFAVSSEKESRVILGTEGAEKLIGRGDMLYKPASASPIRVQGCYISDEDVLDIIEHVSEKAETAFDPELVRLLSETGGNC